MLSAMDYEPPQLDENFLSNDATLRQAGLEVLRIQAGDQARSSPTFVPTIAPELVVERSVSNPWHVSEAGFPRQGSSLEQLRYLLNYAVVAPSGHNTQPWLFRSIGDGVELFADRTRALPIVDPEDRELTISCGAALCQLRLAIAHFGFADVVELFPDAAQDCLLARVALGDARSTCAT